MIATAFSGVSFRLVRRPVEVLPAFPAVRPVVLIQQGRPRTKIRRASASGRPRPIYVLLSRGARADLSQKKASAAQHRRPPSHAHSCLRMHPTRPGWPTPELLVCRAGPGEPGVRPNPAPSNAHRGVRIGKLLVIQIAEVLQAGDGGLNVGLSFCAAAESEPQFAA